MSARGKTSMVGMEEGKKTEYLGGRADSHESLQPWTRLWGGGGGE